MEVTLGLMQVFLRPMVRTVLSHDNSQHKVPLVTIVLHGSRKTISETLLVVLIVLQPTQLDFFLDRPTVARRSGEELAAK